MDILIIEDDEFKRSQLRQFVSEIYPDAHLDLAESLQSGLRSLLRYPPTVILLDMSIPNYDPGPDEPGGTSYVRGGQELLREMDLHEVVVPVIVVTQYDSFGSGKDQVSLTDLDAVLRTEHGSIYHGAVYYNPALQGWKDQLMALMAQATKG